MKYIKLNNYKEMYVTYGFKYNIQPYVAAFKPDFAPIIRYEIIDMINDEIILSNVSKDYALEYIDELEA